MKTVFLHGLWRSGSTYVWSRFRVLPQTYCYYEPLHHGLEKLTPVRIGRDVPQTFEKNAHPGLSEPYFAEFLPLLKGRGVRHYRRVLAYDRFALAPGETHEGLQRYMQSLIDHAQAEDHVPVLGFNRTGLRVGWLKNLFTSYDIHIDRDPQQVWRSYNRHMQEGNNTFFTTWLIVLERNAAHPLLAPLASQLPLRRGVFEKMIKPKDYYGQALTGLTQQQTYFMTFYIWALTTLHALSFCDFVLDMNRAGESGYIAAAMESIRTGTGLAADLTGMRTSAEDAAHEITAEAEKSALSLIKPLISESSFFRPALIRAGLPQLASRKAQLLSGLV